MKYYSEEAYNHPLTEKSIYEYLVDANQNHLDDVALIYFGKKICFKELFEHIDQTAAAFRALGVKEKEIVTVALPSIPEALYVVYALNKIGAVANMIHPLAGKEETINYLNEVNSSVFVLFDGTYQIVKDSLDKTSVKKAVLVTPAESLTLIPNTRKFTGILGFKCIINNLF